MLTKPLNIVRIIIFIHRYPAMKDSRGSLQTNTAHEYVECSNKGKCDRRLGDCICLPGYDGSACQRAACPSLYGLTCAGHGMCNNAGYVG